MEAVKNLEKLRKDAQFKKWKDSHKKSYLVHIFKMLDEANKDTWQFGFYNPDKDTITSFLMTSLNVEIAPDSKVFKEDKKIIKKLNIKNIKYEFEKSLGIARHFQEQEHKGETPVKTISILQNLEIGQVWNITFVTKTFKTLNVKVDAGTGKIVKHSFNSIFDMGA